MHGNMRHVPYTSTDLGAHGVSVKRSDGHTNRSAFSISHRGTIIVANRGSFDFTYGSAFGDTHGNADRCTVCDANRGTVGDAIRVSERQSDACTDRHNYGYIDGDDDSDHNAADLHRHCRSDGAVCQHCCAGPAVGELRRHHGGCHRGRRKRHGE